jgi:murein DD-endopeptidase MepM/ murein hydrolase activator NlpD
VNAERPTSPEDVPIIEEAIAPVWADPTAELSETDGRACPEPASTLDVPGTPADTLAPLPSTADPSSIAAAFIAPPSASYRPRFATTAEESTPVPAAKASTQATAPRTARWRSLRSPAIIALAVPALLGTVALPAYAFSPGDGSTTSITDANAALTDESLATQSLTVSDDVALAQVERDGYSATSAEELEQTYAAAGYIYDSAAALAGYLAPSTSGWWRSLPGEITSKYGPRGLICNGAGCSNAFHEGMDFGGACGTPIKAAAAGTVTFTGNAGAFGNRVIIDHGNGVQTVYGHLLGGSYSVSVGDVIEGGTVIAEVGATGVVSGCHLDLKVSVDGEHINPAPFLRERGVTV